MACGCNKKAPERVFAVGGANLDASEKRTFKTKVEAQAYAAKLPADKRAGHTITEKRA